jgi:hypothetical protein
MKFKTAPDELVLVDITAAHRGTMEVFIFLIIEMSSLGPAGLVLLVVSVRRPGRIAKFDGATVVVVDVSCSL